MFLGMSNSIIEGMIALGQQRGPSALPVTLLRSS
jgi:hypothetical protein